jgi:hypothetical protein
MRHIFCAPSLKKATTVLNSTFSRTQFPVPRTQFPRTRPRTRLVLTVLKCGIP